MYLLDVEVGWLVIVYDPLNGLVLESCVDKHVSFDFGE